MAAAPESAPAAERQRTVVREKKAEEKEGEEGEVERVLGRRRRKG